MSTRTATAMLALVHKEVSKNPDQVLEWKPEYLEEGLGYMRPLVSMKFGTDGSGCNVPNQGKRFATVTPDGRLVVLVVTGIGNVVVMDHHQRHDIVVYNCPKELNGLWDKVLTAAEVESILGVIDSDHNIGQVVKAIGNAYDSMNPWK